MIKIYTSKDFVNTGLIELIDEYFFYKVVYEDFMPEGKDAIVKVDNARMPFNNSEVIETPYGVTDIYHFSTGLKTVLCLIHLKKTNCISCLDISLCGSNALDALFQTYEDNACTTKLYIAQAPMDEMAGFEFLINDKVIVKKTQSLTKALMNVFWRK
jgi:hypothetical protein